MYGLNLADNITRLRHARKITQEELADFLGVTKASVSKWENAQSTPDLLMLLGLSAFFDVTVDGLLGYEPQLSREQIRRRYEELSRDFANLPFEEAVRKTRTLAHRYYSCYPLLLQLGVLYWNHSMLAESKEGQKEILSEAAGWCDHILENSGDVGLCNDALALKAGLTLQMGRAAETVNLLEPAAKPGRLGGQGQAGALLVQAYQMMGETDQAKFHIQGRQYVDLLNLVGDGVLSLALYENEIDRCEKTIGRIRCVIKEYSLENLHPNLAAQFYFQSAVVYARNENWEESLLSLGSFEKCVDRLLNAKRGCLHGDDYFDLLDGWIEELPLGDMAPRDRGFMGQNISQALSHPVFEGMKEKKEFQRLVHRFAQEKGGESYD